MKTAIIILSVIVLVLTLIIIFLCYLVKDKITQLKERFTSDQVMNTWCALYYDESWEYHNTFFKDELTLKNFLMTARLGSRKLINSFNDKCKSINRIMD